MTSPTEAPSTIPLAVDEVGLLCALVLAPSTYSRNRHFALYESSVMRRVLRRATIVRSLVRELVADREREVETSPHEEGFLVALHVPSLGYRRRAVLSPTEHALVEYLVARSEGRVARDAKTVVEDALVRLGPLELVALDAREDNPEEEGLEPDPAEGERQDSLEFSVTRREPAS